MHYDNNVITLDKWEELTHPEIIKNYVIRRIIELCKENGIPLDVEYVPSYMCGVDDWTNSYCKVVIKVK